MQAGLRSNRSAWEPVSTERLYRAGDVAEMERKFSRERQQVGIEAAKAKGVIRDVM